MYHKTVAGATRDICNSIRKGNYLSSIFILIEEIGKKTMKREFGPQIWSPEVTKSAEIVPADGILPPQGRHDTWLMKYP